MKLLAWIAGLAALLVTSASAQSPAALAPPVAAEKAAPQATVAPPATAANDSTPVLSKADVDAWLDGFMPYAMKRGAIPGAVVVVVKDGQVLTSRGFGYADLKAGKPVDPATTLFRPGSVSKLFTWTAVMQLVQQGKLNLDADINQYLDFKIPPKDGKPITLRNLMTHTSGFAETAKYLIYYGDKAPKPLGELLKQWSPPRIYAPGQIPAYSNYGASLAGYIVERVSGEPFNDYVANHIFKPLGMSRSTFAQPLPANLKPLMSKGYKEGSDTPRDYEVIGLAPAGSLASSGEDMGKFMISQLGNGTQLLDAKTAALMHGVGNRPYPNLPPMALGFYHEDRNGLDIIGHGGDTDYFHSDLHLYPGKNVGLYISQNSPGLEGAAHVLRGQLFDEFTDRYFPAPKKELPTAATAAEHGRALAGHYVSSRAGGFNFLRLAALLGEAKVSLDADNNIVVSALTGADGQPKTWREVGPWLWQEVHGSSQLQAVPNADGSIRMFSIGEFAPIIEFVPAPASLNAGWIVPVASFALFIILIAALAWPVAPLVRRRFKATAPYSGRDLQLHRVTRAAAWGVLLVLIGWLGILTMIDKDLSILSDRLDMPMRLLQLLLLLVGVGAVLSAWNAYRAFGSKDRGWWGKTWLVLIAASLLFMTWLAINTGLLTASLDY